MFLPPLPSALLPPFQCHLSLHHFVAHLRTSRLLPLFFAFFLSFSLSLSLSLFFLLLLFHAFERSFARVCELSWFHVAPFRSFFYVVPAPLSCRVASNFVCRAKSVASLWVEFIGKRVVCPISCTFSNSWVHLAALLIDMKLKIIGKIVTNLLRRMRNFQTTALTWTRCGVYCSR